MIKSTYKLAKYENGLPHFAKVSLVIEKTKSKEIEIIENYSGNGFIGQGFGEVIPQKGYDVWKIAIKRGILYACRKLKIQSGWKITVEEGIGRVATDTTPTIMGYAASRAILDKFEHTEDEKERQQLESLVFSSWDYKDDALPDFENGLIEGEKNSATKYTLPT